VPYSPLNTPLDLVHDQHLTQSGGLPAIVSTSGEGERGRVPARPFISTQHLRRQPLAAPRLGEHSVSILQEIGYSRLDVERLIQQKVVIDSV
jgi:crotonobetainyl-CoA:carnitine CoA-transferase CaiB-like acyl-CoA transferase